MSKEGSVVYDTKPDFIGLAHEGCHPERSEGSRGEILRYAQNDTAERLYREVYQCYAFRLRASMAA